MNTEHSIVLLVMQLPVTKHFFCKLVAPLTPLIEGIYIMYVIGSSSRVGGINLIYVICYIKICHLPIDKVVEQTTCEYCATLDFYRVVWLSLQYWPLTLQDIECSSDYITRRRMLHIKELFRHWWCIFNVTPFLQVVALASVGCQKTLCIWVPDINKVVIACDHIAWLKYRSC